ncbi:FecR family protein [Kordiimonas sp.]|uniref:FecR family protein n=1 Tax=Kordiimonas sp. TaxID=1970157 RepID=UPI003A92EE98
MSKSDLETFEDVMEEASKWLARERAGDMTDIEQQELETLLEQNEAFAIAYLDLLRADKAFDSVAGKHGGELLAAMAPDLSALLEQKEETPAAPRPWWLPSPRSFGWGAAVAASLMALLIVSISFFDSGPMSSSYETRVGESRTIMLKDGSVITLNTDTRLSVALAAEERRILLEKGEAYFDVSKDKARPFVVVVGNEVVRAVGTEFNVRRRADVTNVMVTEGVVEVKKNVPASAQGDVSELLPVPVSLTVGSDLTVDQDGVRTTTLSTEELAQRTSWRRGMLHFKAERLDTVVREIQYYVDKEVIIASDDVADLMVGGSINTQNVASFLKGLEVNFPVSVIERDSVIIISFKDKREQETTASNLAIAL